MSNISKTNTPALPVNPFIEAADEIAAPMTLLKYAKGEWTIGDDVVPLGRRYIAHVGETLRGWTRFQEARVVERHLGRVADGFKPALRQTLPDADPKTWSLDVVGQPRDPWSLQWYLPMTSVETDELVTFVTGSKGGIGAISQLCGVYGRRADGRPPIVALRSSSYRHPDYGKILTPDLPIVGWQGEPAPGAKAITANDLDDAIPF